MSLTLGFDTSLAHCGAALMQGDECLGALYEDMKKGQAERLMPMIDEVLTVSGTTLQDIDTIGVGIGPGNFTGIRISVAAARGLALSLGIPAIGVTLLDSLAFATDGPVLACLDARREQGYFQRFGYGTLEPFFAPIAEITDDVPDLKCIGTLGAVMAERLSAEHAPAAYAPASAIARIAARRSGTDHPAPAPLYLRAADAAPARDAGPKILS